MRSRNIKPGLFKNEIVAECSPRSILLWLGLWCFADREGRFEYRPKKIKAEILPYYNGEITELLQELSDRKFIRVYSINGIDYAEVLNFKKHQNPHHTEKASEIPAFESNGEITVKERLKNGELTERLLLIPDSLIPDSRITEPPKPGGDHFSNKAGEYLDQINDLGYKIEIDLPEIWGMIQIWFRKEIHPGAIVETMKDSLPYLYKAKNKRGYLESVMKIKSQNWREKGFIKDHKEREEFFRDLIDKLKGSKK